MTSVTFAAPEDGVIKYRISHELEPLLSCFEQQAGYTWDWSLFSAVEEVRTILHDAQLIGVYPTGIGYGNISLRVEDGFLISGSGTGLSRVLGPEGYSLVISCIPEKNHVISCGPVYPSSESMTHDAIYRACPEAQCVIHAHSAHLFDFLLAKGIPHTPASIAYGTPELFWAVSELVRTLPGESGLFVTAGHVEGVFAYASTPVSALHCILQYQEREDER